MISEKEPSPCEVINPNGKAPLLIACDHASNRVPASLNGLGVDPEVLQQHIAYDIGAKQVAEKLSDMFDAPMISANYSRLVVDLNRHVDDPTLVAEVSDQIVIPENQHIGQQLQQRIDCFFNPYHNQYAIMVDQLLEKHEQPVILSVHSFTPIFDGQDRPWHYGVLWDHDAELAAKLLSNFAAEVSVPVGDNKPYDAKNPQGYAQVVHASQRGIEMALIEIRQDLISDPVGQQAAAETMYRVIHPITKNRNSNAQVKTRAKTKSSNS